MTTWKIIFAAAWILALLNALWSGWISPLPSYLEHVPQAGSFMPQLAWLPVVFFGAIGFIAPHSPFYAPKLVPWVEARFGPGAYEAFLVGFKPILFFAVPALLSSIGVFVRGYLGGDHHAFPAAWFSLSAGVGFGLLHLILKLRGAKGV